MMIRVFCKRQKKGLDKWVATPVSAVPDVKAGPALPRADTQVQPGAAAEAEQLENGAAPAVAGFAHQDLLRAQQADQPRRQWDVL